MLGCRAQHQARPWQTGIPEKKIVAWFKSEDAGQEGWFWAWGLAASGLRVFGLGFAAGGEGPNSPYKVRAPNPER